MNRYLKHIWVLILLVIWSCGNEEEPNPAQSLPSYLRVPANLEGYAGSGLIDIQGGLTLRAEGPESLDPATKTYSGVLGRISSTDIKGRFTAGQPRPYDESGQVPDEYKANGVLSILRTTSVGTYPMNPNAPTPRGEFADLTVEMPGPQIYISKEGSLTISESSIIKTQGNLSLYRIQGSFQTEFFASGVGITPGQPYNSTGTFDLLLIK